jgi:hypothetical protein
MKPPSAGHIRLRLNASQREDGMLRTEYEQRTPQPFAAVPYQCAWDK